MKVHFTTAMLVLAALVIGSSPAVAQRDDSRAMTIRPEPDHGRGGDRDRRRDLDIRVWTGQSTYEVGDSARIYFRTNRDAYVYIYSTDPRGVTTQIFPNYYDRENWVEGGRNYRLPRGNYRMRITPPTGREVITAYAVAARSSGRGPRRSSSENPFPRSSSPQAELRSIVPDGRPSRDYASDTASIRIVHPDYRRGR
jgi:hypothetical protein